MRDRLFGARGPWWVLAVLCLALLATSAFAQNAVKAPTAIGQEAASGFAKKVDQDDSEIKRNKLFPRASYVWPYASGPFYGMQQVPMAERKKPGMLHTRVGSFDLTRGLPSFPDELRTSVKFATQDAQYFIVQFHPDAVRDGAVTEMADLLAGNGGAIVSAMPVGAYVARLTEAAYAGLVGTPGLLAVEPYHPAIKLSPYIGRAPLGQPDRAVSDVYRLGVELFEGEDAQMVAALVAAQLEANVLRVEQSRLIIEMNRQKLAALAALEPVAAVYEDMPVYVHAEETSSVIQTTDDVRLTPYTDAGVDGGGGGIGSAQILMVLDSGIQLDGGDLSDTKTSSGTAGGAHRKVEFSGTTGPFGGAGDLLGCDASSSGSFTHGHTVSATALGWASRTQGTGYIDDGSGIGYVALDDDGNPWNVDGVAPGARLIHYDADQSATTGTCNDPLAGGLNVGTLYPGGSLDDAYSRGARTTNFSWGSENAPTYSGGAVQIDNFLFDNKDAMVFVSAGNSGADTDNDGVPDPGSISTPATCKGCVVVGASFNQNAGTDENSRAGFSSVGPATAGSNRVAPILMAPGSDLGSIGNTGLDSEFNCKTTDNDQADPVECDVPTQQGASGTSFSSPAAAGAALVVRDYLNQGFYPDGTNTNAGNTGDRKGDDEQVSGALVKAVLIASTRMMTGGGLSEGFAFNNEQGYGRVTLDAILPLNSWAGSPTGLILVDTNNFGNLSGASGTATNGVTETASLTLTNPAEELRIAIAWVEDANSDPGATVNNIDLVLTSPSGKKFRGNVFTEDANRDDVQQVAEDCNGNGGSEFNPTFFNEDEGRYSIDLQAGCTADAPDTENPTEMIVIGPDPRGNGIEDDPDTVGIDEGADNPFIGELSANWTLDIIGSSISQGGSNTQEYALVIGGPVALRSSARFSSGGFVCNAEAGLTINEVDEAGDPGAGLNPGVISARTTVQVVDANDVVQDTETGLTFDQPDPAALNFVLANDLVLTDGTARNANTNNNGVLDVRSGERLRVIYDEPAGLEDASNEAQVGCKTAIQFGGVVWGQFGLDSSTLIDGGCERDARGKFTFGFPDKSMDAGELIGYRIAFLSGESLETLTDAKASLRCVVADADSPEECKPGTTDCDDPDRLNNAKCTQLQVLDSPKTVGVLPPGNAVSVNFTVRAAETISGTPEVDMLLGVTARTSGKTVEGLVASRHILDTEVQELFYSTDWPSGFTEIRDYDNDEVETTPTTDIDFSKDYLFESRTWEPLGAFNQSIGSPWDMETDPILDGWSVGLHTASDLSIGNSITNWGEDRNFDGIFQSGEDGADSNLPGALEWNWNTLGGCGWQTGSGVFHTGRIDSQAIGNCLGSGNLIPGQCQSYETVVGYFGQLLHVELLKTPEWRKVHFGDDAWNVEFINFAWNMQMQLEDPLVNFLWELDTSLDAAAQTLDSFPVLNGIGGPQGPRIGGNAPITDGYLMFASTFQCSNNPGTPCEQDQDCIDLFGPGSAPGATCDDAGGVVNGILGGNRTGDTGCYFDTTGAPNQLFISVAGPDDDDVDQDSQGGPDEFVTANGPIRNFDLTQVNGPDMRSFTLEDIYGESGERFQAAFGILNVEGTVVQPSSGYGAAIDDVVAEWREFTQVKEGTNGTTDWDCAGGAGTSGSCASIVIENTNVFEGSTTIGITVVDATPRGPGADGNDCDFDGTPDPGPVTDCDGDLTEDVPVKVITESGDTEIVNLEQVEPGVFSEQLAVSASYNSPGVLFLSASGTDNPTVRVQYFDADDGTGAVCPNDTDPAVEGTIEASTTVFITRGTVVVKGFRVNDNTGPNPPTDCPQGSGDGDGFADADETVCLWPTLTNKTGIDLSGMTVRMSTTSPEIDCIIEPFVDFGTFAENATVEVPSPFVFKVSDTANRAGAFDDFTATFNISVATDQFSALLRAQQITLDLDLDLSGGSGATTFTEDFETGLGDFTNQQEFDLGKESIDLSDGWRCQYNDPDFPNANNYPRESNPDCFMGFTSSANRGYDWEQWTTGRNDAGRALSGNSSMHWGIEAAGPERNTSRFKSLEAIGTGAPIYLSGDAPSEFSFYHQVSLADFRCTNTPFGEAADRGVVHLQLADNSDNPVGEWIKLEPFENVLDVQGTDAFVNCKFDPTDDGDNEDDFFDPSDPNRRLGPSSTCFPEFVYGNQGDTDYRNSFNAAALGRASDGPGFQGSIDRGTWIQTKFDLSRYLGRRIFVRFLMSTIEVGEAVDYNGTGIGGDDEVCDDGWFIDLVQATNALTTPATLQVDPKTTDFGTCGSQCAVPTASLTATPAALAAPGQVTTLDAIGSSTTRCLDGTLQYKFWNNINGNGVLDEGDGDVVLRDWTDNAELVQAPALTTNYAVQVRCSTEPNYDGSCTSQALQTVTVTCPDGGAPAIDFAGDLGWSDKDTLSWSAQSAEVDLLRGSLDDVVANGTFDGSVQTCLLDGSSATSFNDTLVPGSGLVNYYVARLAEFCNTNATFGTGTDAGDRDAEIRADGNGCP